jgi:hypothetical protein
MNLSTIVTPDQRATIACKLPRTQSASHRVSSGSFFVSPVVPVYLLIYSRLQMLDRTETLKVGSRAPEFALEAANREGMLTLSGFLRRGTLIAEFLRGTW